MAGPTEAATMVFTNAASFAAAFHGSVLIDFEKQITGPDMPCPPGACVFGGASFFATNGIDTFGVFQRDFGTEPLANGVLYGGGGVNWLQVDLPGQGSVGFGTNLTGFQCCGKPLFPINVTLSTGESFVVSTTGGWPATGAGPGDSYFGAIADQPIQWVRFQMDNDTPLLDNVTFTPQDVPEPAPAVLSVAVLMALGIGRAIRA